MDESELKAETVEEKPIFSTSYTMDEKHYWDLNLVSFRRFDFIALFIALIPAVVHSSISFSLRHYSFGSLYDFFPLYIAAVLVTLYIATCRAIKKNYKRNRISYGKDPSVVYRFYENRIEAQIESGTRQFAYSDITKLKETNDFLLLHIQLNLYILIEKNAVTANLDTVKPFILSQCTNVKKKRFVLCRKTKKIALALTVTTVAVCVAEFIVKMIVK